MLFKRNTRLIITGRRIPIILERLDDLWANMYPPFPFYSDKIKKGLMHSEAERRNYYHAIFWDEFLLIVERKDFRIVIFVSTNMFYVSNIWLNFKKISFRKILLIFLPIHWMPCVMESWRQQFSFVRIILNCSTKMNPVFLAYFPH